MENNIALLSFSFRQGLPNGADMVIDARFLQNPFYVPSLKEFSGLDKAAGDYIESDPDFPGFFAGLTALLVPLLPRYLAEKNTFTLAIGCTGGRHRSVYVAKKLGEFLRDQGYDVAITHRDLK
jgi:RNase adapter protein RapZ